MLPYILKVRRIPSTNPPGNYDTFSWNEREDGNGGTYPTSSPTPFSRSLTFKETYPLVLPYLRTPVLVSRLGIRLTPSHWWVYPTICIIHEVDDLLSVTMSHDV